MQNPAIAMAEMAVMGPLKTQVRPTPERECISRVEEQLRAIDAMVADTREVIEKFKHEQAQS